MNRRTRVEQRSDAYISVSIMPMFKHNTLEHIPGIVLCPGVDILTRHCGL